MKLRADGLLVTGNRHVSQYQLAVMETLEVHVREGCGGIVDRGVGRPEAAPPSPPPHDK